MNPPAPDTGPQDGGQHRELNVVIIPARLASTRFPGKMLADRTGWPLIRHVYESAQNARLASRVVVAADDDRIVRAVESFGGEVVLTSPSHPNGTARLAEAARILDLPGDAVVVNVQGDEPEIEGTLIDAVVDALRSSSAPVSTAASPMDFGEDPANPNLVKVVLRADGTAMYFSRAPIPFPRDSTPQAMPLRHVGVYAYRASFLQTYVAMPETPLESTEMLEQLRVLEHGYSIAVAIVPVTSSGIDTPEQYEAFVRRWRARQG